MKLRRRSRKKALVPLTSFGDIAFLLIIFFMVASIFMREQHINITEAASPDIDLVELAISVVVDEEGEIWLEGQNIPKPALESQLSLMLEGQVDNRVMLKIDRNLRQRDFGDVIGILADAGAEILLLGEKERE